MFRFKRRIYMNRIVLEARIPIYCNILSFLRNPITYNYHCHHQSPKFYCSSAGSDNIPKEVKSFKMAALPPEVKEKLDKIEDVKIDANGKFKYILIKVFAKDKDGKHDDANSKLIVRGRADCPFHGDIFEKYQEEIQHLEGIDDDILGGGRILREANKIIVFGYSQGYGRADHNLTVELLKRKYPTHEISWKNIRQMLNKCYTFYFIFYLNCLHAFYEQKIY